MKKVKLTLLMAALTLGIMLSAQVPQQFNYQAVARTGTGAILANQNVSVRISVIDGSPTGTVVYSETQTISTNQFGLFSIKIGTGTVVNGNFGAINWATGNKFLKTEFDQNKIAGESCFNDGILLSNTIYFIVQRKLLLNSQEQFLVLKEIVRVHNLKLPTPKHLVLDTDKFNQNEIVQNSIKSELTSDGFQIYLFSGKMPRLVVIDGFDNYVFYKYNEGDYFVAGTNIYINEMSDQKKTLEKVVSDDGNDFKFEDLWKLYNKEPSEKGPETIEDILPGASDEEIAYISEIINISRDKDGEIDANSTAKIKTLMLIKGDYRNSPITDEGRYLKAGNDEILVRSAQKGLLYLDLFHWERLNKDKVKIAVYTNSQINILSSKL